MMEERYFPVWDQQPSEEFVSGWHEALNSTGYPELFDRVSTVRPFNLADVRLLSGELRVPTTRRESQSLVPCPLCQPNSPKFKVGRMAWFPHERTVLFIGHECAKKHIGEDYVRAEKHFRRERRAMKYKRVWHDLQSRVPALTGLLRKLEPMVRAIDAGKVALEKDADGFAGFILGELTHSEGKVSTYVDTGLTDNRGRRIAETVALGTVVGLRFLERGRLTSKLREAQRIVKDIEAGLPEWNTGSEDSEALDELLNVGHRGVSVITMVSDLLDTVSDARVFLHENNLALMERWASADDSPFDHLSFRRKGSWIFLDSISYAGHHKANFRISDEMFADVPSSGRALSKIDLDSIEGEVP